MRERVKRSKTYSGCWTCRGRRVKCDNQRPQCERCRKSSIVCHGYSVKLVWEAPEKGSRSSTRRQIYSDDNMLNPTFSESYIETALEILEGFQNFDMQLMQLMQLPFTVFSARDGVDEAVSSTCSESNNAEFIHDFALEFQESPTFTDDWDPENSLLPRSSPQSQQETSQRVSNPTEAQDNTISNTYWRVPPSTQHCNTGELESYTPMKISDRLASTDYDGYSEPHPLQTLQSRLQPLLQVFLPESSSSERHLLHYWVTSASWAMIATDHLENPFRNIVLPIILESACDSKSVSSGKAVQYAVYSLAAHWLCETIGDTKYRVVADKNCQASLQYLQKGLMESFSRQNESILIAIVLLICIDVVTGNTASWKCHIQGGQKWLDLTNGGNGNAGSIVGQFFKCFETVTGCISQNSKAEKLPIGPASIDETLDLSDASPSDASPADDFPSITSPSIASPSTVSTSMGHTYMLHTFLGVTEEILKMIDEISLMAKINVSVSSGSVQRLALKLQSINPSILSFPSPTPTTERLTRHHACVWYYSTAIYFERQLKRSGVDQVQHLVQQSLWHLEAIDQIPVLHRGAALLWPICVTICEANEKDFQERSSRILEARHGLGIRSTDQVEHVAKEVWKMRAEGRNVDVRWQDVVKEIHPDIILL